MANRSRKLPDVKYGVEHVLETTGRPVMAKFCRLDPNKIKATKVEFLKMEAEGIIRQSRSSWASPLHMVKKTDRDMAAVWGLQTAQPCRDVRQISCP